MLAVNGSTTAGDIVWEQTVAVVPGETYDFAAAISSWFPAAPAALLFTVNGEDIGALNAPEAVGTWEQVFATWDSGNATSATIRIVNANLAFGGNDFALDEIYFGGPRFSDPSYQYQVEAIDADFDPISYVLDEAPAGMSIDESTGFIGWNPTAEQLGTHTVRVVANDGRGGTATQEYQVLVLSDQGNSAPVIISNPIEEFFVPGFSNPASGQVTPQRISLDLGNGETFDGTVSITLPESAGRYADIVLAVDESGSMGGDQEWVAEMIPLLDTALINAGIGADPANPNRFGIIGFGGGRVEDITVGHFLNAESRSKYTLYGPGNEVVQEGFLNDVIPDELLNLELPDDGQYVLVVEPQNVDDLDGGIDIGFFGNTLEGKRLETLELNTITEGVLFPGQPVEYTFNIDVPTLIYFDSLAKDDRVQRTVRGPKGELIGGLEEDFDLGHDADNFLWAVGTGEHTLLIDSDRDVGADYQFQILDLNDAQPITSGQTVNGEFELKRETLMYRFQADAGKLVQFVNSTVGVQPGSQWRIVDQTGNLVATNNIGTNQSPIELSETGDYYLLMESGFSAKEGVSQLRIDSTFEFTLDVLDPVPPVQVVFGDVNTDTIDYVGDFVDYTFELTERSLIYVDSLVNNSMTWTLDGPAGNVVNARRFNATDSFNIASPVFDLIAGTYSLRVDGSGQVDGFDFRVLNLADATEITPGVSFSGELTIPNETDMYRFDANAGDEFFFDVEAASDTSNTEYKLIDPFGEVVFESSSLNDQASTTVPSSGTYTLLVEGWRGNVDQDTYTMNVVPVTVSTSALALNAVTNGNLATPGQRIEYSFNIADDYTLIHFDSLSNRSDVVWSLEGPRGEVYENVRLDRSDSNFTTTTSALRTAIELMQGDYRLTFQGVGDAVGGFDFRLINLSDAAQSTLVADPVSGSPTTITGTQTNPIETQVYRFDATAGDLLSFDATTTGSITSDYRLVDPVGRQVFSTFLTSDRGATEVPLTGTYYLLVEGRMSNADNDDYSIVVTHEGNNPVAPLSGDAYALGSLASGDLSTAGQVDSYEFTLTDPTVLYLDTLTNSSSIQLRLRGPRGVEFENQRFDTADSFNKNNALGENVGSPEWRPGTYVVEVYASSGAPGAYAFRLSDAKSGTVITPGVSFSGELTTPNQTDIYNFDAQAGDSFFFDVEATSDINSTEFKLIDPFGRLVFISNRLNDRDVVQVDYDGTYTLVVEGQISNVGADTYTMNVRQVVDTVTPLTIGQLVQGEIENPGQQANYSFSVSDWTQLHFDSLTQDSNLTWTLNGPAGTAVNGLRFDRSDSVYITNPVFEIPAGDYTLTVDGIGATVREFQFTLLDLADSQTIAQGDVVTDSVTTTLASDATWTTGVALTGSATNGAIDLSRSTDGVRLPNAALDGLTDFTVEFWYKTNETGFQSIISAANASEDNELLIHLVSDTQFEVERVGAWTIDSVADDQWHHYAVVHEDGVGTTFYLDGVSQGVDTTTLGTLSVDPNGIVIGQEQDGFNGNWDLSQAATGQLDELRIWNTVRSATDVADNKDQL
ncbi:MAG: LamG-like jellyroll fold domain-containing protein [Planctomycetota bacterium]